MENLVYTLHIKPNNKQVNSISDREKHSAEKNTVMRQHLVQVGGICSDDRVISEDLSKEMNEREEAEIKWKQ